MKSSTSSQPSTAPIYKRGDIWMVDFGNPIGREMGFAHPALIVSAPEINSMAAQLERLIAVPGTSTRIENRAGRVLSFHLEVAATGNNGLDHTTYFQSEQVRSLSTIRFQKCLGSLSSDLMKQMEDRLCLAMKLFG